MREAHQKTIKNKTNEEDLKRYGGEVFTSDISEYEFKTESMSKEVRDFILRYEALGTVGVAPRWIFTARVRGLLACVVCLNLPNTFSKILGEDTRKYECLIQRGASASFCHKHVGSKIIRYACNWMVNSTDKRLFLGYADPQYGERGIIYQAAGFEYLGSKWGSKILCVHPGFKNGKPFSPQSLRRTSLWRRLYKEWHGLPLPKEWLSENGFKNMSKVPEEAKREFYDYGHRIVSESRKIDVPSKGKYALVLGANRREQRHLNLMKQYKTYPYPKDFR